MKVKTVLKALLLWAAILLCAMANGALRELLLIPALGTTPGLVLSGLILSGCVFAVAWFATPWYGRLAAGQYRAIGLFWLVLTLAFEFGFGRLVQHKSWPELLQAYTFKDGNLWPVVLVMTLVAPWLAARRRGQV